MAKDSLNDALHGLKVIEKKRSTQSGGKRVPIKRGRPKAFDPFYLFCVILTVLGIGVQLLAIAIYS